MRAALVLIALLLAPGVRACDYVWSSHIIITEGLRTPDMAENALRALDIVAVGRVIRADDPFGHGPWDGGEALAQIVVERRWKGPDVDTLTVVNGQGVDCVAGYALGARVVLYADSTLRDDGSRETPGMFIGWPEHIRGTVEEQTARLDRAFAFLVSEGWDPAALYRPRPFDFEAYTDSLIADARARGVTGGIGGGVYDDETNALVDLAEARIDVFLGGVPVIDARVRVNTPYGGRQDVGGYQIDGLQPGRYVVRITVPGYAPEETAERWVTDDGPSIPFRLRRR